jgi:hypothetical protein
MVFNYLAYGLATVFAILSLVLFSKMVELECKVIERDDIIADKEQTIRDKNELMSMLRGK